MDKKGQAILIYFMMGIVFFLLGLAFAFPLTQTKDAATNSVELNCTNFSNLSNQDKANCSSLDILPAIFIGTIFSLGGLLLTKIYIG